MRTETRTVRIGEAVGPVDWDYDFGAHGWDRGGSMNPECLRDAVERLRVLDARGDEEWEATTDGGSPRVGWGRVLQVAMYDGWPYWRPIPSVLIATHLGAEWSSVFGLRDIRNALTPGREQGGR